ARTGRVDRRAGRGRNGQGPRAPSAEHGGLLVLHPAGAGVGRLGARAGQLRQRHQQCRQGGGRVRPDAEDEDPRPAGADHRHPRARPAGRAGHVPDHGVVLGPGRRVAPMGGALRREDEEEAVDAAGRRLLGHHHLPEGRGRHRQHRWRHG
ncbi:hypothetical protein OY671_012430, partial [Metschnikowia pulcherrima]